MRYTSVSIAGLGFEIGCPSGDSASQWTAFQAPDQIAFRLSAEGGFFSVQSGATSTKFRVTRPHQTDSVIGLLVGRCLAEARTGLTQLHGNAVTSAGCAPWLFIGASGTGKSTLSAAMRDRLPESLMAAEDLLLLNAEDATLWAFPRAASRRLALHAGKEFVHHPSLPSDAQMPLAGARVVLIERAALPLGDGTTFVLHLSAPLSESSHDFLPPSAIERGGSDDPRLELAAPLAVEQLAALIAAIEQQGVLVLAAGTTRPGSPSPPASQPRCAPLAASEALPLLLEHQLRRGGAPSAGPPAIFQLARALRDALFFRLEPGGTPGETIGELLRCAGEN